MARYDDTFVGRFLEPWNRHDVDGALALMTDDCVWEVTRGREPHGTLLHRADGHPLGDRGGTYGQPLPNAKNCFNLASD